MILFLWRGQSLKRVVLLSTWWRSFQVQSSLSHRVESLLFYRLLYCNLLLGFNDLFHFLSYIQGHGEQSSGGQKKTKSLHVWFQMFLSVCFLRRGRREETLQRSASEFHEGQQRLLAPLSVFKTTSSQRRRNCPTEGQREEGGVLTVLWRVWQTSLFREWADSS